MIISNVKLCGSDEVLDITVHNEKIAAISHHVTDNFPAELNLKFERTIVFPGLINSHDHLDFNLYPQFGNNIYSNYTEWGKHIHENYSGEIAGVLKIPQNLRSLWGIYKNLLCGVTTVVNHGEKLGLNNDLITVFEDTHCLHSVQFEKSWKIKLNNPLKLKFPVNIHVGEGEDFLSFKEIDELTKYNLFRGRLIGIHAVAMSQNQARKFEAVVWCPESNFFLLNKTAKVHMLKKYTNILFGTDSTLTSSWNVWEHLRLARKIGLLDDNTLYNTINKNAAQTWKLNSGEISEGKDADLVVAKIKNNKTGFNSFFETGPADLLLVLHKGNIRLFDETLLTQLNEVELSNFSKFYVDGVCKYVQGDLPGLMEKIKEFKPGVRFPVSVS